MKIHQLTPQKASELYDEYLDQLILENVKVMSGEQKAILNALYAFEGMYFWASNDPERAKLYACEFELLQPQLERWIESK